MRALRLLGPGSVRPTLHWFVLLETGVWLVAVTGEVIRWARLQGIPAAR